MEKRDFILAVTLLVIAAPVAFGDGGNEPGPGSCFSKIEPNE